jgi:serine/threonine-protein kinase
MLYELACGERPFSAQTLVHLAFHIAHGPHVDVRAHAAGLPAGLARLLDRALAKRPEERFATMEEFATAIRSLIASLGFPPSPLAAATA